MVDAPERIWAMSVHFDGPEERVWIDGPNPNKVGTEYVRADLYAQVVRERGANHHIAIANGERAKEEHNRAEAAERLAGARVKALEWEDADEGMCTKWRAAALGGHYELVALDGDDGGLAVNFHWGRPLSFWFIQGEPDEFGPTGPKIFLTLESAKAAAQADYERRILSALAEPAGEAEPVQVGWAYRDKRWDEDRWHVCGWEKPRESAGREVRPIFIGTTPPNASAIREAEPCQFLPTEDGEFNGNTFSDEPVPFGWITQRAYDHAYTTSDPVQVTILRTESGPGLMPRVPLYTTPPDASAEARTLLEELRTFHANDAGDKAIKILRKLFGTSPTPITSAELIDRTGGNAGPVDTRGFPSELRESSLSERRP